MEPLNPPSSGAVYFDANVFIYTVERIEPYFSALNLLWDAAATGKIQIVSSELSVLETLIKPLREENESAERVYRALFSSRRKCAWWRSVCKSWNVRRAFAPKRACARPMPSTDRRR